MYHCLGPWWNKTEFHLPKRKAGNEFLQKMSSEWNEELFLWKEIEVHFQYPIKQMFGQDKIRVDKLQ